MCVHDEVLLKLEYIKYVVKVVVLVISSFGSRKLGSRVEPHLSSMYVCTTSIRIFRGLRRLARVCAGS